MDRSERGCAIGSPLFQFFALSAVVMGLSHTIAKERIFLPVRERLGGRDTWVGYLVSCPYCVSHWLAFMLVPLFGVYPIQLRFDFGVVDDVIEWFLAAVLMTVIAAFLRVAFWFLDESQSLTRRQKRRVEEDTRRIQRRTDREERMGKKDLAADDGADEYWAH